MQQQVAKKWAQEHRARARLRMIQHYEQVTHNDREILECRSEVVICTAIPPVRVSKKVDSPERAL